MISPKFGTSRNMYKSISMKYFLGISIVVNKSITFWLQILEVFIWLEFNILLQQ